MADAPVQTAPPLDPVKNLPPIASTHHLPPDLSQLLSRLQPKEPLAPYSTVTHVGKSFALVLPDGGGDLVLLANNQPTEKVPTGILQVHGIAASQAGRAATHGRRLTIRAIGCLVEFVHQSEEAKAVCRLTMKDTNHAIDAPAVTTIAAGMSAVFTYDEKLPGWRQA